MKALHIHSTKKNVHSFVPQDKLFVIVTDCCPLELMTTFEARVCLKHSGQLVCFQEETDHHLKETFSDPVREQELGEYSTLIDPPEPSVQFNMTELQLKEV